MAGGGSGETNAGTNLGGGTGVYAGKSGTDLQFRSLQGAGSVEVNLTGSTITLSAPTVPVNLSDFTNDTGYITGITATNLGGGQSIIEAVSAPSNLKVKSLTGSGAVEVTTSSGTLKVSAAPNPIVLSQLTDDVGYITEASANSTYIIDPDSTYYVAKNGDDTNGDGSLTKPFLTINQTLSTVPADSVIFIFPGTYTEDVDLNKNITLTSYSPGGNQFEVKIQGKTTISNGQVNLNNIALSNTTDYALDVTNVSTSNGCKITYCTISRSVGVAARFSGSWSGSCHLQNIWSSGTFQYDQSGFVRVEFSDLFFSEQQVNATGAAVELATIKETGAITHSNGNLILRDVRSIAKNGSNESLISTCNAGNGILFIQDTFTTQSDLTLGRIVKSGTCPWEIMGGGSNRSWVESPTDPGAPTDWLNGPRLGVSVGFGHLSRDVAETYTPSNYTGGDYVTDHFEGIDTTLGDLYKDLGEFTVAGLPSASANPNAYALATDASGGRTLVRSDGTNWKVIAVEGATVTT